MTTERKMGRDEADRLLSGMVGEYVWLVRCVEDNVLRMEFGEPHLKVDDLRKYRDHAEETVEKFFNRRLVIPTGRWSLFIEDGFWEVEANGSRANRSESSNVNMTRCLNSLSGQQVTAVDIARENFVLSLDFDIRGKVNVSFTDEPDPGTQWMMFLENSSIIACNGKESFTIEGEPPNSDH